MTSQDISRSLYESGENETKAMLSPEMKHACDSAAENVQQNHETREQCGAFVCSNNIKKTLAGNDVQTIRHRKGERTWSIGSHISPDENNHLLNSSLAVQKSEVHMLAVSSDGSENAPLSTFSSELSPDQSNESQTDNKCTKDLNTLHQKKIVGSARERYLSVIETENSSPSFHNISTAKSNHYRFDSFRKDKIRNDNNATRNISGDQSSSVFNTNKQGTSSHLSVNIRDSLNGKCLTPKDLSKTSEASSIHVTSSKGDIIFSEQGHLHRGPTTMSIDSESLRVMHCPSPELQTSKADLSMSGEILNSATVKSLKSMFGAMDHRPTPASASSSVCSQNCRVFGTRVRIKPSFTIQRIQEQLFQKMENDEVKFSSSKTMQKLVHKTISEQHQVAETNANELSSKTRGVDTDKLHKEEKPYRQWHRMSRVVTADSKFIISPMLPCHPVAFTRQNILVQGKPIELVQIKETVKTEEKQHSSTVAELGDITSPVDCSSCEPEASIPDDNEFHKVVMNTDFAEAQISLTNKVLKKKEETNEVENASDSIATPLPSTSDKSIQNTNQIVTETKDNTDNGNKIPQVEGVKTLHEPGLSVRRIPKYVALSSIPRNKTLNLKTLYSTKYQSFNEPTEVSASNTRDRHHCSASADVDKLKPLNSVSGASQVTGPSFAEFKNDSFKLPSKKAVSGCPKLRTATRTRNSCNSPGLTQGSTNLSRGADSQNAHSNLSRHNFRHSREGSRNVSSDRRSDSARQREQRMCTQPRSARNARAHENDQDNPDCINRNWSSQCPAAGEIQKEADVSIKKPRKVFLADVASKLMQKVNRANTRVPREEPSKKYTEVKATQDYNGALPGQLSFRKGQIIKQRSFVAGPSDGMGYGYYRVGRLRKKKKGLFPMTCVVTDELDALDGVSLTSSAKSAV